MGDHNPYPTKQGRNKSPIIISYGTKYSFVTSHMEPEKRSYRQANMAQHAVDEQTHLHQIAMV